MQSRFRHFILMLLSTLMMVYIAGSLCLPLIANETGSEKNYWNAPGASSTAEEEDNADKEEDFWLLCEHTLSHTVPADTPKNYLISQHQLLNSLFAEVPALPPEQALI